MKCNLKEIALMSDAPCVIEGRLNYKKTSNGALRESVFKERWFRLVKNHLFYFKLSEFGKFDARCPAGALVLENSSVQLEQGHTVPFAFSVTFTEEPDKRHVLAARSQESAAQWVSRLRSSSYEYLRSRLHHLQSQLYAITGQDPLLLVPRNEGAKLWAPSVPFSTAPACSSSAAGFSCHLHTHDHLFTLDRSRSDFYVAAHSRCATRTTHVHATPSTGRSSTRCTVRNIGDTEPSVADRTVQNGDKNLDSDYVVVSTEELCGNDSQQSAFDLRTLAVVKDGTYMDKRKAIGTSHLNPFHVAAFDSGSLYTRPAPSPPVRKKVSPKLSRSNTDSLVDRSRCLGTTSILDQGPTVPPRRKISPKCTRRDDGGSGEGASEVGSEQKEEDLIKF